MPPDLERLVLDLLAKQPEQRPVDAYEVYQRLLPLLPPPGAPPPEGAADLGGMPDPTLVYRLPNAPRLRREVEPAPASVSAAPAAAADADEVREALKVAVMQSDALLAEERFAQAAEVLQKVVGPAGRPLPRRTRPDHHRAAAVPAGARARPRGRGRRRATHPRRGLLSYPSHNFFVK